MPSDSLLDLAVQVRELSGRPLDEAGLERLQRRIHDLSQGEATAQRTVLKGLIDHANGTAQPVRDRP